MHFSLLELELAAISKRRQKPMVVLGTNLQRTVSVYLGNNTAAP